MPATQQDETETNDSSAGGTASRAVLVIGAARGIGLALVKALDHEGYGVIAADYDAEALRLAGESLPKMTTVVMDITDGQSVRSALTGLPALEAVVISAAAHSTYPIEYVPDEHLERIVDINFTSHVRVIREALPKIKTGGKIIGISSNAAGIGIPMESIYAGTKAAIERVYEALSIELSYRKIYPVIIQPGNVNTGFNETGNEYKPSGNAFVDSNYEKIVGSMSSRFGIPPEDVVSVIVKSIKHPRPKVCYIVGKNALKTHWARRLLGVDLALRVMRNYFNI
jgi:NAD(P)-dependent dehydrogenase (short-subunit alcohol dehydrogenase family)